MNSAIGDGGDEFEIEVIDDHEGLFRAITQTLLNP